MSFLGTWLELDEGSRLTDIGIQPLAHELRNRDGWVYAHFVRLPGIGDADASSGAVTRFLESGVATIHGNEPDGGSWMTVFQFAPADVDGEWANVTANDALDRALDLCGVSSEDVSWQGFTADELRDAYRDTGADTVADWSVCDLLVGLLVELTNTDLAEVAKGACDLNLKGDDLVAHRIQHLCTRLAAWASTHDGPEA